MTMNATTQAPRDAAERRPVRQWLRMPQVLAKTQTGKTWLYSRMKDEADPFPSGIKLSARCIVWDEEQVDEWMARQADRLAGAPDLADLAKTGDRA